MTAWLRAAAPWALAFFALASLFTLEGTLARMFEFDEGFVLVDALRLSRGEVPYRDYDLAYGPLEAATLAPLVRALGPELILLRALRALSFACVVLGVGLYLWRRGARAPAVLAMLLVASFPPMVLHAASGALFAHAVAALHALHAPDADARRRRLICAGLLAGLTGLARYDFGALALAATALALGVQRLAGDAPAAGRARSIARDLAALLAGTLPALCSCALLAVLVGPDRLGDSIDVAIKGQASGARRLPFPLFVPTSGALNMAGGLYLVWAGPFALLLGLGALVSSARRRDHGAIVTLVHLLALLLGLLLYARFRPDVPHLFPGACAATIMIALLVSSAVARPRRGRAALAVAVVLLAAHLAIRAHGALLRRSALPPVEVPGLRGLRLDPLAVSRVAAVLGVLDTLARADEPVFVGCEQHERIIWNDALLYALARRPIPTRSHHFNPGWTTTEPVQRAIIDELERARVRVVVLRRGTWYPEPNASALPGSSVLDDWLRGTFTTYATIDDTHVVLVRRD